MERLIRVTKVIYHLEEETLFRCSSISLFLSLVFETADRPLQDEVLSECDGKIEYVRYFVNGPGRYKVQNMVIKLENEQTEHFNNIIHIQKQLFDAMVKRLTVKLITDLCRSGNHEFERYELDRNGF